MKKGGPEIEQKLLSSCSFCFSPTDKVNLFESKIGRRFVDENDIEVNIILGLYICVNCLRKKEWYVDNTLKHKKHRFSLIGMVNWEIFCVTCNLVIYRLHHQVSRIEAENVIKECAIIFKGEIIPQ